MSTKPEHEIGRDTAVAVDKPTDEKNENGESSTPSLINSPEPEYTSQNAPPRMTLWGKVGHWLGDLPEWSVGGKKLSGKTLNFYIGFIASNGFLMFGYDQGVLSALITLPSWQRVFPLMTPRDISNPVCWIDGNNANGPDFSQCTGSANLQAFAVAIYQIGCFLGAVVILFYGEKWGRKPSTFWGSLIMIIGTIMQAAANGYALLCIGRVVGGVGNGMVGNTALLDRDEADITSGHFHYSDMAVRVRSPREARRHDHSGWCCHFWWCYDCKSPGKRIIMNYLLMSISSLGLLD